MPTISGSLSIAANATSANVLAGSPFEFVSQPSIIKFSATHPGGIAAITGTFQIGGESVLQAGEISNRAAMPTFREDLIVEAGAQAGERLFLTFTNTTGAAIVARFLLDIMPI